MFLGLLGAGSYDLGSWVLDLGVLFLNLDLACLTCLAECLERSITTEFIAHQHSRNLRHNLIMTSL